MSATNSRALVSTKHPRTSRFHPSMRWRVHVQRKDRVARTFTTVVSWRASELHWRMFDGGGAYDALYDGEEAVWLPDQRSFQFNPFCPNLTCLAPIHVAAVHGATLGRGLQACIEINKGFLSSSELLRHPIQQTVNCGISFPL